MQIFKNQILDGVIFLSISDNNIGGVSWVNPGGLTPLHPLYFAHCSFQTWTADFFYFFFNNVVVVVGVLPT